MVEEEVGPLDQLNKVGPLDQLDKVGPLDQLDKEPKSEVAEKPVTKKWVARPLTTVSNCFLLDIVVETHACNMIDRKREFCTYDKFALFSYSIQQEFAIILLTLIL